MRIVLEFVELIETAVNIQPSVSFQVESFHVQTFVVFSVVCLLLMFAVFLLQSKCILSSV